MCMCGKGLYTVNMHYLIFVYKNVKTPRSDRTSGILVEIMFQNKIGAFLKHLNKNSDHEKVFY